LLEEKGFLPGLESRIPLIWGFAGIGVFSVHDQDYEAAKRRIDGRDVPIDPLASAGEEGSSLPIDDGCIVLLPQTTWIGFRDGARQKTATVIHELAHVEDHLFRGPDLGDAQDWNLLRVWREFFAENIAAPYYDAKVRQIDLHVGMTYLHNRDEEALLGLEQLGRVLGFLHGNGHTEQEVRLFFQRYGSRWQVAATNLWNLLPKVLAEKTKPIPGEINKAVEPLFH